MGVKEGGSKHKNRSIKNTLILSFSHSLTRIQRPLLRRDATKQHPLRLGRQLGRDVGLAAAQQVRGHEITQHNRGSKRGARLRGRRRRVAARRNGQREFGGEDGEGAEFAGVDKIKERPVVWWKGRGWEKK